MYLKSFAKRDISMRSSRGGGRANSLRRWALILSLGLGSTWEESSLGAGIETSQPAKKTMDMRTMSSSQPESHPKSQPGKSGTPRHRTAGSTKPEASRAPKARKSVKQPLTPLGPSRRFVIDRCERGWMVLVGESARAAEVLTLPGRFLPDGCEEGALVQLRVWNGWTSKAFPSSGKRSRLEVRSVAAKKDSPTLVSCRAGKHLVLLSPGLFERLPRKGTRLTLVAERLAEQPPPLSLIALLSQLETSPELQVWELGL